MRVKINWLRHLSVLIMTIMIFTLGIFIGGDVEEMRVQNLYTQLQEQDVSYQSIVTESNYIDYMISEKEAGKNVSCQSITGAYYTSIKNLDDSRLKLENYINTANVKEEEYERLKEHYSNIQIDYWIMANKINNLCDANMYPVLYFYADEKKCPGCEDQGVHLSYTKAKLGDNILIFSLDSQKEGPIQLLAQQYDVNSREMPVIVIENQAYGFSKNEEIIKILCEEGLNSTNCN